MFRTREPSLVSPETQAYASAEVARIARVSLRQLQWREERRVVSPGQDNHKRLYQPDQAIEVSVIAELRRKGFSLQTIRRVLRFLEKGLRKRLSEVLALDSEIHLLTDGKSIYLEDAPERIIDLPKDARQPMFLVRVTDQARRLATAAQRKPPKSEAPSPVRRSIVG
ncbi:MAG: MerR family transcriptional regulator [Bryobacteraceae bacterium]|jgi:DNA-binding transcriptional MerR regulator